MGSSKDQPRTVNLLKAAGVESIEVASTDTARTYSFPLPFSADSKFCLELQFASGGAVDVKIEREQGNSEPATEGSADDNLVIPDGASAVSSGITDENVHMVAFSPNVTKYCRFLLTGQGTNAATTVISRAIVTISE